MRNKKEVHFRYIRIRNAKIHPGVMIDESNPKHAEGMNFTHNPSKLGKPYHKLHRNPNPKDKRSSYLVHEIHEGAIGNNGKFSKKTIKGYRLSLVDRWKVQKVYKSLKRQKRKGE